MPLDAKLHDRILALGSGVIPKSKLVPLLLERGLEVAEKDPAAFLGLKKKA